MKKAIHAVMAALLVICLVGWVQAVRSDPGPTVEVDTPKVKMTKKAKVVIKGTGFKPGQEVRLVFTTADGVKSDIGGYLKPEPVADKTGAWTTTWNCGTYIRRKLIKEGTYTITVTDNEYNHIVDASLAFYVEKK